jgi:predicted lipid-binding transport protein (Tim44 family)
MFDVVLRLRTRSKLRDPRDAKSRYTERYFLTENDGRGTIAKCRSNYSNKPLLDSEEIFDPASGVGTFDYMLKKILAGYAREGRVEGAHA